MPLVSNTSPHLQSLHFLPGSQIEIFLILVLGLASPLSSIVGSCGSTHLDIKLKVRSFSSIYLEAFLGGSN